jgi:hypothetical protein
MNVTVDSPTPARDPLGSITIVSGITLSAGFVLLYFLAQSYKFGPWAKFKDLVSCPPSITSGTKNTVSLPLKLAPAANIPQPPGPASGVFTGTSNFVVSYPHIWWNELAKKYGPIVSVWRGQNLTIVLSNPEDIQELLNRRGTTYSSRPPMHVFHDILFKSLFIPSCAHNDVSLSNLLTVPS